MHRIRQGFKNLRHWLPLVWDLRPGSGLDLERMILYRLKEMDGHYRQGSPSCLPPGLDATDRVEEIIGLLAPLHEQTNWDLAWAQTSLDGLPFGDLNLRSRDWYTKFDACYHEIRNERAVARGMAYERLKEAWKW
jgi:hypothetical protein